MPLKRLRLTNLGPFDEIEFELDEHVNVFTGPNNSGKSTALMALGEIVVLPFGIPRKLLRTEATEFEVQLGSDGTVSKGFLPRDVENRQLIYSVLRLMPSIGFTSFVPAIRRSTDFRAKVPIQSQAPDNLSGWQTILQSSSPLPTHGISDETAEQRSLRALLSVLDSAEARDLHRRTEELQAKAEEGRDEGWRKQVEELRREIEDKRKLSVELAKRLKLIKADASSVSDEAVVQKMVELDYRAYRRDEPAIRGIVEKTATIASEVTEGYPIRFVRVEEDDDGLFPQFETPDGLVPLNVLSQGTQSLIQWLAHLLIGMAEYYDYPEDLAKRHGVLIIDEIDAHLHPSWQRRIIPALTDHFPNLQIFCSTHSPLMLAGLKAGQVQLLERADDGRITVSRNERDIVAWSADEILRGFLDVPSPTDLETARSIERLQELRRIYRPTEEQARELECLRETVRSDLMDGPLARDLEKLQSILNETKSRYDPTPSSE